MFTVHLLGNDESVIEASLEILMTLGGSSGRDGDKIRALAYQARRDRRTDPARRALLRGGAL